MTGEPGPSGLLALLQHADSFFPGGQVSFSWGLEGLKADARLADARAVAEVVAAQLKRRWALCERPVLAHCHKAAGELDAVAHADRALEAAQIVACARDGSRRLGAALLSVHTAIGTDGAEAYRERVRAGAAPGHQAAVQGLLWRAAGLRLDEAEAAAAHGLAVALLGAALRLGLIGHLEAQRCLTALRGDLAALLARPAPPLEGLSAYAPGADIAMMRHETRTGRLFAT